MKKITELFLAIFLMALPTILYSEQITTNISAETITVTPKGFLKAEGNVLIENGKNILKADTLIFDQENSEIKLIGVREFYDGHSIRLSAKEAEIDEELSEGIIHATNILLDETIKIEAENVSLKDGEIFGASGISQVTSCEKCEGKTPNWYLTASSAKRDVINSNIVYRNVTVRIKGLTVFYLPYLRMPDPSIDRAVGFLVPETSITSNLATGIKLPYFIPIGSSRDILITPYLSSKTKTLEYRYQQKFRNGDLTLKGAFSSDDLIVNKSRYFSRAFGSLQLGFGLNLNFDAGKVGDNSYLGDYSYSEESDLKTKITLEKMIVEKQQFFEGNLSYNRQRNKGSSLSEYYSLSGSYTKILSQIDLPGNLKLLANVNSAINVNDDNNFSRPPSSTQVGLHYAQENFSNGMHFSSSLFATLNSFVNSADTGETNEEVSVQYGASTLISTPFINARNGVLRTLSPKISLSFNGQDKNIVGDFFIGPEDLSWGNLYSEKKITSLTESEKDFSVSIGADYNVFWQNGSQMEISLATSKIGGLTYVPSLNYGITNKKFNFLGKFSYKTKNSSSLFADGMFSSEGKFLKGDLRGKYIHKKIELDGHYEILDKSIDNRISDDLKTLDLTSHFKFFENFKISKGFRYDVANDQMAKSSLGMAISTRSWDYEVSQEYFKENEEKLSLSAIYDDDCTRFTFSFENRFQELGSSEPVKSLTLRLQLKPFASVFLSQGGDQLTF